MDAPVNVLLIGPTQTGKSTLINRLTSVAVGAGGEAPTGDGMQSCTTGCKVYEVKVPMTRYKLVNRNTHEDVEIPEDEQSVFDLFWRTQEATVEPVSPRGPLLNLRLIDTPGLDDSRGRDQTNIYSVLQYLTQMSKSEDPSLRSISTILFVCNANKSLTRDFQDIFRYYQRCMPNLFGSLAIVNTHFSIEKWQQKYTAYLPKKVASRLTHSAKDDVIQERRAKFFEYLGCNPRHFFIDSRPRKRLPFEVLTSLNDLSEIINYLSFKDPMPIKDMRLIKFDPWMAADSVMVGYLSTIKHYWEKAHKEIISTANEDAVSRDECTRRILDWEAEIAECEKELELKDSDVVWDIQNYNVRDQVVKSTRVVKYATFSRIKQSYKITEAISPFYVRIPEHKDGDEAWWAGHHKDPETGAWTGQFEVAWRKVPSLGADSYTYNRFKYADVIREVRSRKQKREIELVQERTKLQRLAARPSNSKDDGNLKILSTWIARCDYFIKQLMSDEGDLTQGFNKAASERYAKGAAKVGPADLFKLVKEEDESFEAVLRTVERLING